MCRLQDVTDHAGERSSTNRGHTAALCAHVGGEGRGEGRGQENHSQLDRWNRQPSAVLWLGWGRLSLEKEKEKRKEEEEEEQDREVEL